MLVFPAGVSDLSPEARAALRNLVRRLEGDTESRVQILAYAGGADATPSEARRMSLSRALAVRSFLIEEGIRSTRINVRALGSDTEREPRDRVDLRVLPS